MKNTLKIALALVSLVTCQAQFDSKSEDKFFAAETQQLRQSPRVQASGAVVTIDDKKVPNEFYGPLYIGSDKASLKVSYDTLSEWTIVSQQDFQIMDSTSKKQWLTPKGLPIDREVVVSHTHFKGPIYNESMCLISAPHGPVKEDNDTWPFRPRTNRLCVEDMPFVYAPIDLEDNSYQGVLGLARGRHDQVNFVKMLKNQGIIREAIVSLNFEDYSDRSQISQIAFGEILSNEIEGGMDGLNYYTNLGRQQWGLQIDDFLYNDDDMTKGQKAKVALIDSKQAGILLPEFVWDAILVTMQHTALKAGKNYRIFKETNDQGEQEIRISEPCADIWADLSPIEFKLEQTTIVIQPSGYTYQIDPKQRYCQVGLHPIMGNDNEYILGYTFLKNFYTVLDYEKDEILIGVNKGSSMHASATIQGHKGNPFFHYIQKQNPVVIAVIIVFFIIMVLIAVVYFILEKKKLQRISKKPSATATNISEENLLANEQQINSGGSKQQKYAIQSDSIDDSQDRDQD